MLTPFYGSSVYVLGTTISVFLAGLSIGYAIGGKISERRTNGKVVAVLQAIPSVLILTFPLYAYGFSNMIYAAELDSRLSALLTSIILFFVPCIFMGATMPVIIDILADKSLKAGTASGRVYSVSTAGSIIGTLFTSCFLISWVGVSTGIVLTGSLLMLNTIICLLYHLKANK